MNLFKNCRYLQDTDISYLYEKKHINVGNNVKCMAHLESFDILVLRQLNNTNKKVQKKTYMHSSKFRSITHYLKLKSTVSTKSRKNRFMI